MGEGKVERFAAGIEHLGIGWVGAGLLLLLAYTYAHYMFASTTAHITAMYGAFYAAGIALGAPPMGFALLMAAASSIMMTLTHYATGTSPIIFNSGYTTLGQWWFAGLVMSVGVAVIIVLGGDGTSRAACKGARNTPLLPLSTGTNNVFPIMTEATVAGLAAGVLACGGVSVGEGCTEVSLLEVLVDDAPVDMALVDGTVSGGQGLAVGDLDDWPFTGHDGRFEASGHIVDGRIRFQKDWPAMENLDAGVAFVPGADFFPRGGGENHMRLNFSNAGPDMIRDGIARLAAICTRATTQTR